MKVIILWLFTCAEQMWWCRHGPFALLSHKLSLPYTYARMHVRAATSAQTLHAHALCLPFILWLVAIARHPSRQLGADTRGQPMITPTPPPSAPLTSLFSRHQTASLPHEENTSLLFRSLSFFKTYNPLCPHVSTVLLTFAWCSPATFEHVDLRMVRRFVN